VQHVLTVLLPDHRQVSQQTFADPVRQVFAGAKLGVLAADGDNCSFFVWRDQAECDFIELFPLNAKSLF